jgi:hypothetical protein
VSGLASLAISWSDLMRDIFSPVHVADCLNDR